MSRSSEDSPFDGTKEGSSGYDESFILEKLEKTIQNKYVRDFKMHLGFSQSKLHLQIFANQATRGYQNDLKLN